MTNVCVSPAKAWRAPRIWQLLFIPVVSNPSQPAAVQEPSALPLDERRRRHESLQAALDLIDQGFTLIDDELRMVAWNKAFLRQLDFPEAMG